MKPKFNILDKVYWNLYDDKCIFWEVTQIIYSNDWIRYSINWIWCLNESKVFDINSKEWKDAMIKWNKSQILNIKSNIECYEQDLLSFKKDIKKLEREIINLSM